MTALFGPAGNSESFAANGHKKTIEVPAFVNEFGLTAYEYQCGHGVRVSNQSAAEFGEEARKYNLSLSIHAPYYISLSGIDPETRNKSVEYILQTARAAKAMGASRFVVHSGSAGKISREEALALAKDTLTRAWEAMKEEHLDDIILCPETMRKFNQLGNLQEVMELCKINDHFLPCIDFGHLNARTLGSLQSTDDYEQILDTIENELGFARLKVFHSHFSQIEYTEKGGEKRHLTFADEVYGPFFEPLAELVAKKGLTPTFICESAGTQAEDAQRMQQIYLNCLK